MPTATTHTTPEAPPFKLLADDEPDPVVAKRIDGASPFFLTCDHAGKLIPKSLGRLGVPESELQRHIAWDIGIAAVSARVSEALDAALVMQIYSRLVIDCNRDPLVPSSICEISESTPVPGNMNLDPADRRARQTEILEPYHTRITAELDRRQELQRPTILIAMHSFTPVFKEIARPWHVGVLHNRDTRMAGIMLDLFRREEGLVVGDNEPYYVSDLTDYGIPVHGEKRGLPHIELEIRQDLITEEKDQREWADRLIRLLPQAFQAFNSRVSKAAQRTPA
jgi:predicted N-formylglutamate amidohydrolase